MDGFANEMTSTLFGNPHSASWPSQLSATRIEDVRLRLLSFFNADPTGFDLVFVANATAGVKLVVEGMRSLPEGFIYAHHQACHTSLVGVREEAKQSVCLDDDGIQAWINGESAFEDFTGDVSATLVAYTAQSHMDGQRYPLSWSHELRNGPHPTFPRTYTLLDAASFASTSPLDLGDVDKAPDFTVLSLYKIFGFPDLGVLIVRRQAQSLFSHRKYFGGGTVDMVVCGKEKWHAPKTTFLHERLEDGTLPFHNIIAVDTALSVHQRLFGSMQDVRRHTAHLTEYLLQALSQLRHSNGNPVCVVYTNRHTGNSMDVGPVVAFNAQNSLEAWVSLTEFEKLSGLQNIHVRTGGLCSPGGIAEALHLEPWEIRKNFSSGFRCGGEDDIIAGKPTGVIRVSLGAMSTLSDVQRFIDFMAEYFVESKAPQINTSNNRCSPTLKKVNMKVKTITVYPVKSCGGFTIPDGCDWPVRPEGLAWDREWCLVHRGSGQALSQKRYPKMALLRPFLDFEKGLLRVDYGEHHTTTIPLSANPALFEINERQTPSRVCGEDFVPQVYASYEINNFFSAILGVSCVLARFPPGGRDLSSRLSKARIQTYQERHHQQHLRRLPGAYYDNPSPPESDSDPEQSKHQHRRGKILLSNESPILMINRASVDALNEEIAARGAGPSVDETAFRANIVVQSSGRDDGGSGPPAYSEDTWTSVRIGVHDFKLLGACRRCQMVCVDQATGEKRQEPFSTLAKTRRFDGKVYFGTHMGHVPSSDARSQEAQHPTIRVGDAVVVDNP